MKPLLITGGRVVDPGQGLDEIADLLLVDGQVAAVGKEAPTPSGAEIIDAGGMVVAPGLIDMHVHLRDPGQEYKEDIISGGRAAAAGGFTAVAAMANTDPVIDSPATVRYVIDRASMSPVRVYPVGALTKNLGGSELAEIGRMMKAGAVAFSDDGKPVTSGTLMRNALQYAGGMGALIIVHEEDLDLVAGGSMHEGAVSGVVGLKGIPAAAEEAMLARDILLLRLTGGRLHVAHLSTAVGVDMVRGARAEGLAITAEVSPHHLLLTDRVVKDQSYSTDTKVNPPLRPESDRQALWQGLLDGTIDAIASDHAPHHPDDKDVEYDFAPFGIAGLETTLPLLLDEIRHQRVRGFDIPVLVDRLSTGPARILGVAGGSLAVGAPADVTIIDPARAVTVDPSRWYSKSRNTPFAGRHLSGGAAYTIVGGRVVMREGQLTTDD